MATYPRTRFFIAGHASLAGAPLKILHNINAI